MAAQLLRGLDESVSPNREFQRLPWHNPPALTKQGHLTLYGQISSVLRGTLLVSRQTWGFIFLDRI